MSLTESYASYTCDVCGHRVSKSRDNGGEPPYCYKCRKKESAATCRIWNKFKLHEYRHAMPGETVPVDGGRSKITRVDITLRDYGTEITYTLKGKEGQWAWNMDKLTMEATQ